MATFEQNPHQKIIVDGCPRIREGKLVQTGTSNVNVLPGDLVETATITISGTTTKGVKRADGSSAGNIANIAADPVKVAVEDTIFGGDVNQEYVAATANANFPADASRVRYAECAGAEKVYLNLAAGETAAVGSLLGAADTSSSNEAKRGKVEVTTTAANAVAEAQEAVDNSSGTTDVPVLVVMK